MSTVALGAAATTGTVSNVPNRPVPGQTGREATSNSYDQYTVASTLGRTYFLGLYIYLAKLPSALERVVQVLDSASESVCSLRITAGGVLQLFDHEGNQQGSTITLDLNTPYLVDLAFKQEAAGKGTVSLWVNNELLDNALSVTLTNVAWNRIRVGVAPEGVTTDVLWFVNGLNDNQGTENNARIGGTVYPGTPAKLRPSGHGRNLSGSKPTAIGDVNNVPLKSATDRVAFRFVPDENRTLYRFLFGVNMEGVDTKADNVTAAPTEIRNPGGTGRSGYGNGNGGTIRAQLVTCNNDGTPNLGDVLATQFVNAVERYEQSKALFTPGATVPNQILYVQFNKRLEGGRMYAVVITNATAESPTANFFSVNCPTTSIAAAGPNRLNTLNKNASGAIVGLDPRECVFWTIDSGAHWWTGEYVGGDTAAQGIVPARAEHIAGYYSGFSELETDQKVRLPWYGFLDEDGTVTGLQPYYNYLEQLAAAKLICRKAGRSTVLTEAGGFAPAGKSVGVVTVTNVATGVSGKTAALGSGLASGALDVPVPIGAGESFTISCTGTVYLAKADSFLVSIFGLGGGDWPFTTEGSGSDMAQLFAAPWPYFGVETAVGYVPPPPQLAVVAVTEGGTGRSYDLTDEAENLSFSNVNPGGDELCTFTLHRAWFAANPEVRKGTILRIIGGVDVLWEGRIEENDRDTGDSETIGISAYGLGNRLADSTFREIYVDRDMSQWGAMPNPRIIELGTAWNVSAGTTELNTAESGYAALSLVFSRLANTKGAELGLVEAWYDSGGIALGSIYLNTSSKNGASNGSGAWVSGLGFAQTDSGAVSTFTGWGTGATTMSAPGTGYNYAALQLYYNETIAQDGDWRWIANQIAVYGRHGLVGQGALPYGFTPDQIAVDMASRATGIQARNVTSLGYIVPQFTVRTPTTPKAGIDEISQYANVDYGVWGPASPFDRTGDGFFDYTEKDGSTQHWVATRADFEPDLSFHSETSTLYDTVDVTWTDEAGKTITERHSIYSPDLAAAGLSPRVYPLDAGQTTAAGAELFASIFLNVFAGFAPARGTGTLLGTVQHYQRGQVPVYYLRADGANIRIPDILPADTAFALDSTPDRRTIFPIKRVTVDCSGDAPRATVEFDQNSDALSTLLAQQATQASLVGG